MNAHYIKAIIFIIIIRSFFPAPVRAQQTTSTTLSGKVFDKSTNQPLEYATISILSEESGKTINGTIADDKGFFKISGIPSGIYKINIEFIGYEKSSIDSLSINSNKAAISLGKIYLSSSTQTLQNVIITGDKPIVENKIDKIVYNASNDITSQGGMAIDILRKVPQVTVDIDGNVELQGNSNIRFLINGKPSSIFGNSLADALASIPASQIKSVEAITNPGAKYDSQGTGGIINIILYDNKMEGINGNFNLSAGTRFENGSGNLNLKRNNFGVNAYFSGNAALKSKVPYSQERHSSDTVTKINTSLMQDGNAEFKRKGFRSGIGFDWDITKNDIITGSIGYNQFGNQSVGVTNQKEIIQDPVSGSESELNSLRNSTSHFMIRSLDWSLDYKKKFKKEGQELDILYTASDGRPNSNYNQTQTYNGQPIPYMGSASINPGTDSETEISIDYAHPVTKNFLIESGAKTIIQNLGSISDVSDFNPSFDLFTPDSLQSYHLHYNMRVYAGYLSMSFSVRDFLNVKAGVRYEYTEVNIDSPNTSITPYGTFVPTIVLSHNFNKNQSLKFAYSKRIERPEYRQLNPFINRSDPYNIVTGNALLKPEIGNNFELGYSSSFKKGGNITMSLIERINTQDVKQITTFYPAYPIGDSTYSNVSVTNPQNVGEEYNSSLSVAGSYPVTGKLNIRGNLLVTHKFMVSNLNTGNLSAGFRARLNLNATWQLNKNLVCELYGNYSSASQSIQGKVPQFLIYSFALRKMFLNNKASFGFTTTNPFNKYVRQVTTISTENYSSSYIRYLPLRSFGISLSYKFGKMEFNKKKDEEENNYLNNTPSAGN